ncbi:MAG: HPr family phosphocarrier protein [Eubacteriales bacterium]|nr:HPr family phosphocarrier protein [Eubacteriales bacterium]
MTEIQIKLPPDSVSAFVKRTQNCDFNIDIAYDHTEIDGKSLLGILSLDLNRVLNVRMDGSDQELEGFLQQLSVTN